MPHVTSRRLALLFALLPCACAGTQTESYFGTVTPRSGVCDPAHQASLVLEPDAKLQFTPTQGILILPGHLAADGSIEAALTLNDMNHKPATYRLAARREGETITGSYTTPRCVASVTLERG